MSVSSSSSVIAIATTLAQSTGLSTRQCPCRCLSIAGPSRIRTRFVRLPLAPPSTRPISTRTHIPSDTTRGYYRVPRDRPFITTTTTTTSASGIQRTTRQFTTSTHPRAQPQPRPLSDDPCPLPPGYTFYPYHSDKPSTPPTMANIITSPHAPPLLPLSSVINYLFPSTAKTKPKEEYYKAPDPNSVSFIDGLTGEKVTREQVGIQAGWLATGLKGLGLKKGDVGMTFGFNSLLYVNAIMGMQYLGCIVSPANAAYAPDELLHQMSDSTASFIFIQPPLLPTLDAALAKAKSSGSKYSIDKNRIILLCPKSAKPSGSPYKTVEEIWVKDKNAQVESLKLATGEEATTAYLCYSSGTTGRAKGVETTHHNMTSQVQGVNLVMEPLEAGRDRCLGILPFSHIYGLTLLIHWPLTVGIPIIVLPRFDEIQVLKVIQQHKITFGYVVPPVLIVLLNSKNVPNYDISSLRGVMSGAAPLSADLAHAVQEKLGFGVTQGYGLTETSPVSHVMTLQESLGRKGRIGKLMPTYQARLVAEDGKDVIKQGERGELWVRGPSVMKGYWKNEEATKNTFADGGWFMTGDVAEVDPEGYFAIVDRVKELIKYKGFQVPPAELEALLLTHPKIADAAVIAYPSPSEATELPRAYIVPKDGVEAFSDKKDKDAFVADVSKWVADKVANHKRLRGGVVLIEAIPKSPSGKILRKDLRAMTKKEIEDKVKDGREAKL